MGGDNESRGHPQHTAACSPLARAHGVSHFGQNIDPLKYRDTPTAGLPLQDFATHRPWAILSRIYHRAPYTKKLRASQRRTSHEYNFTCTRRRGLKEHFTCVAVFSTPSCSYIETVVLVSAIASRACKEQTDPLARKPGSVQSPTPDFPRLFPKRCPKGVKSNMWLPLSS